MDKKQTAIICSITNSVNDKTLILSCSDAESFKEKFETSKKNNIPFHKKLQKDWAKYGSKAFRLDFLEELEQCESQDAEEFQSELKETLETWREKFDDEELY